MKNEFKITDAQIADGCNEAYVRIGHNAYFANGFNAGVEFALKLVNDVRASAGPALPIQNVNAMLPSPVEFAQWIRDNTTADGSPLLMLNKDFKRYDMQQLYDIACCNWR